MIHWLAPDAEFPFAVSEFNRVDPDGHRVSLKAFRPIERRGLLHHGGTPVNLGNNSDEHEFASISDTFGHATRVFFQCLSGEQVFHRMGSAQALPVALVGVFGMTVSFYLIRRGLLLVNAMRPSV